MPSQGWKQLLDGYPWYRGKGRYFIQAYSEYMPPPHLGRRAYGARDPMLFNPDDPWGWPVTEHEETFELRPGLCRLGAQILDALVHLGEGRAEHCIAKNKLADNEYWPAELAAHAGKLSHERYVILMPLALSRSQDDKGRVPWTLFGGSEQGPARAFWRSFYVAPRREAPEPDALDFFRRLLAAAYGEAPDQLADLRRAGLRIFVSEQKPHFPYWREEPLPSWTDAYRWRTGQPLKGVKYLLTFCPFGRLPAAVRKAYLAGELHLLPFPGSLVFWGAQPYLRLQQELPLAMQIPLLHQMCRHRGYHGIRVPQSGWMHEHKEGVPHPGEHFGPIRNTFQRTHRWERILRDEDELALAKRDEPIMHVLFSTLPDDVGLYGKPTARNVQLWTHDHRLLLDGPRASPTEVRAAMEKVMAGGLFGYRFQFPAMRVGRHEVYWHRPLVAYRSGQTGRAEVLFDAPLGYLTAYRPDRLDLARPLELWPRLLKRELEVAAVELFEHHEDMRPHQIARNIREILYGRRLLGTPLERSFAQSLVTLAHHATVDAWLDDLPQHACDKVRGQKLASGARDCLAPPVDRSKSPPTYLTYDRTAQRAFEVKYWKTIAFLAESRYRNKNNADCARDPASQKHLAAHSRHLEELGDYLLKYYERVVAAHGMEERAWAGELPFSWQTDLDYSWMGGWLANQIGDSYERNLIVVIPGRDRRRAVIMGDHYDTAYMEDHYYKERGGSGARLAAAGADDNHSATAALMMAAPVLLEMSKAGKLGCDVWLIHLTGEEFPADCMGARHLCQSLVEGSLRARRTNGRWRDLSKTRAQGVYVLDMVAHNNDHHHDIFQIAPGACAESLWLAYQAHLANEAWNYWTDKWNHRPARRGRGRGRRSADSAAIPDVALHPRLCGEVRVPFHPRSTLYNTDGQIFSDAGVPVVLFMENYDINRQGYHDSHDTMENIDLDYGSAVTAITIESVARAATAKPLKGV
jgi:hypothetical protein